MSGIQMWTDEERTEDFGKPMMSPFIEAREAADGYELNGPVAEMLSLILSSMHLRPILKQPPDGQWGYKVNGSFTGAIGMLQRKEIDLFIGPAGIIAERLEAANCFPYLNGYSTILTPHPRKLIDPFSFVKAFAPEVWLTIGISWSIVSLISMFGEKVFSRTTKQQHARQGYFQHLWKYLQYMLPQGCNRQTDGEFGRILLGFWFLAMMVLMSSLGGELKTSMLLKKIEDHIDSVDDLLRFPKVAIVAESGSALERFFKRPEHPTFQKLLPRLQPVQGSMTSPRVAASVLDLVEARSHVFVVPLTYLKGILNSRYQARHSCRFHIMRNHLSLTSVGMYHRKDLPVHLRNGIEKRAGYMIDTYLLDHMIDTKVINYTRCLQEEPAVVSALSTEDVHGVFYMYLVGILASIISFIAELASARPRENNISAEAF
ncbi:probable glutamate receptor isoform X2 [Ornithodoros turicata]|uniref:probable glutamate receptor isoform X2 n=1 Tax=Ornithodoros turicata TaxID=34597 RepID=UPI0031396E74